ncbi:MAG: ribonuclease D [Rhodospirillaceae bacterium]|nr:ribonuclease D [Rhodospirillaceae bacterium]
MTLINDNTSLNQACQRLSKESFISIDTEFMRERTYYPKVCLIQIAGENEAIAIDTLAPKIQLKPMLDLLGNNSIVKVFHACRQDMEIFFNLTNKIPTPIFDTQIGAMVCGYGDSVSYDKLVRKLIGIQIDKSSRFTDWSHRPLSKTQLNYALSDVTHLREVYKRLVEQLDANGRLGWLEEEFNLVKNPRTYTTDPSDAWKRLKVRSGKPRFLILLKELAAFRETEAQRRDIPRNRIIRDDILLDIAARSPRTPNDLAKVRNMSQRDAIGSTGQGILRTVEIALEIPEEKAPQLVKGRGSSGPQSAIVDLLRVLLKLKSEQHSVAQKLIASASDLEAIAENETADVAALRGWRLDIFGRDALLIKSGKIALSAYDNNIKIVKLT